MLADTLQRSDAFAYAHTAYAYAQRDKPRAENKTQMPALLGLADPHPRLVA